LPTLDFEDRSGALNHEDAGSADDGEDSDDDMPEPEPKPMPMPDPGPDGNGDGDEPDEEPTELDDAGPGPEPTPDAGAEPGDLTPHADNPDNCPSRKPAERGICTSFDTDTCKYGTVSCRCIAVAWLCSTIP
jgi:hypothetical protein